MAQSWEKKARISNQTTRRRASNEDAIFGVLLEDSCKYFHINLLTEELIHAQGLFEDWCELPIKGISIPCGKILVYSLHLFQKHCYLRIFINKLT